MEEIALLSSEIYNKSYLKNYLLLQLIIIQINFFLKKKEREDIALMLITDIFKKSLQFDTSKLLSNVMKIFFSLMGELSPVVANMRSLVA